MGDDLVYSGVSGVATACFGRGRIPRECLGAQLAAHYAAPYDARDAWYGGIGAAFHIFTSSAAGEISLVEAFLHAVSVDTVAVCGVSLRVSGA